MNKRVAIGLLLLSSGATAGEQALQSCKVLVADQWIAMGATTISGCLKFAEAAASPGETQLAKLGNTDLSVYGKQYFQSRDGGRNWQPVSRVDNQAGISTLNVLQPSSSSTESSLPADEPVIEAPPPPPEVVISKAKEPSAATTPDSPAQTNLGSDANKVISNYDEQKTAAQPTPIAPKTPTKSVTEINLAGCQSRTTSDWVILTCPEKVN